MLLGDFLREEIARLESLYPAPEARNILLLLCSARLGTSRYTYLTEPGYEISAESLKELSEDTDRLASGEPIQYVLGYEEFCGRRFKVCPDVLIPRPETEILCAEAIKISQGNSAPVRVLDLCTGSGCIAWTIALDLPGSVVYGVDISPAALAIASTQHPVPEPVEGPAPVEGPEPVEGPVFLQADILQDPPHFPGGKFDLILANPPYIKESQKADMRPNVLNFEPALALFAPDEDPLVFYRAVARWSRALLAPGGTGIVEINELLGPETRDIFLESGFGNVRILRDFSEKNRFVVYS